MSDSHAYNTFPHDPSINISPFHPSAPQAVLDDLKRRLEDAAPLPDTYETSGAAEQPLGVTRKWVESAIKEWKQFDWRKKEAEIDSFNNFTADLELDGHQHHVHFVALFSHKEDAVPVCFIHGWPGSFMEFLPMINHLKSTFTPDTLPVHVIVPSMIGFGYSSPPPKDREFVTIDNGTLFNKLMKGLGFNAYVTQGGDVGSMVAPLMGEAFDEVKAVHVNFLRISSFEGFSEGDLDEYDKKCVERLRHFDKFEMAYAQEHGTKSSTISIVVQSSPVALLAWIGEKLLVWSDPSTRPPLDTILADITLYYVQSIFATGMYHYRSTYGQQPSWRQKMDKPWSKPLGYSQFPFEMKPVPIAWAKQWKPNIVFSNRHDKGGHFAALENPLALWSDVYEFIKMVWK